MWYLLLYLYPIIIIINLHITFKHHIGKQIVFRKHVMRNISKMTLVSEAFLFSISEMLHP